MLRCLQAAARKPERKPELHLFHGLRDLRRRHAVQRHREPGLRIGALPTGPDSHPPSATSPRARGTNRWTTPARVRVAATGGGVSAFIATPSWQTGPGVPGTAGRYTPDVSFSASTHDDYFMCLAADGGSCVTESSGSFHFETGAGTSAATPSMAGIAALLNQKMGEHQGSLNPRLYGLAATPDNRVFHDITIATSGVSGCSAADTQPLQQQHARPDRPGRRTPGLRRRRWLRPRHRPGVARCRKPGDELESCPKHRQLPGTMVGFARGLRIGMGHQLRAPGRHDLRHLVHIRPGWARGHGSS